VLVCAFGTIIHVYDRIYTDRQSGIVFGCSEKWSLIEMNRKREDGFVDAAS
jgi:hypothetical protein